VHDVLEVFHGARQAVDAGDDQRVVLAQELEQRLQLSAPATTGAAGLLSADDLAAGGLERGAP